MFKNVWKFLPILAFCAITDSTGSSSSDKPVLNLLEDSGGGILRGKLSLSKSGRYFVEFLGIPYAISQRFELSSESFGPNLWAGFLEASNPGPKCPQKTDGIMNEDCLTLNIATPEYPQNGSMGVEDLLPVLVVLLHDDFRPNYFLDYDVIIVTLNYRTGVFGFPQIDEKRSNLGLEDQTLALKWVQKYIEKFGGDSQKISILGSKNHVQFHLNSKESEGLFSKVIVLPYGPYGKMEKSPKDFNKLANLLDCNRGFYFYSKNNYQNPYIDCLKRKTTWEILEMQDKLQMIDSEVNFDSENFENFEEIEGKNAQIPMLIGFDPQDVINPKIEKILETSADESFENLLEKWTRFKNGPRNFPFDDLQKLQKISDFYSSVQNVNQNDSNLGKGVFFQFLYDLQQFSVRKSALSHSSTGNGNPTYLYYFNKTGKSVGKGLNGNFNQIQFISPPTTTTSNEKKSEKKFNLEENLEDFSEQFVEILYKFALTGTPNVSNWTSITPENLSWFKIQNFTQTSILPEDKNFETRMQFWENLLKESEQNQENLEKSPESYGNLGEIEKNYIFDQNPIVPIANEQSNENYYYQVQMGRSIARPQNVIRKVGPRNILVIGHT